ncbi:protein FAM8A1-like isoform X1, partial [Dinothrombium tinctorium]
TLFLCLRQHRQRPGGATPGKMFLGLKVISCTQVIDIGNDVVQVLPAEDIGFWRSLLRAVIKNVSSVFFLPTSLTVFVSNHKRAAYDFASKSIVVEEITGNAQPRRN